MDGWTDGQLNRRTDGRMVEWMDGTDGKTDGRTDGCTDGRGIKSKNFDESDGRTDGRD